jgi:hypothetical protein
MPIKFIVRQRGVWRTRADGAAQRREFARGSDAQLTAAATQLQTFLVRPEGQHGQDLNAPSSDAGFKIGARPSGSLPSRLAGRPEAA